MEHELLSLKSDSWTDAQQQNPCNPTVTQGFAEHTCLPTDRENWEDKDFADPIDPIEDFSEDDHMAAAGSMAAAGRSPKHPRTGSEEDSVDLAALLDRAADRFCACMDTKVVSMRHRLEKRIDERIDSKLVPVMDRLSALEKTSDSTRSGPSSTSEKGGSAGLNGGEEGRGRQHIACGIRPFFLGDQGVVRIPRQEQTWFDGGSGYRSHCQAATGN